MLFTNRHLSNGGSLSTLIGEYTAKGAFSIAVIFEIANAPKPFGFIFEKIFTVNIYIRILF